MRNALWPSTRMATRRFFRWVVGWLRGEQRGRGLERSEGSLTHPPTPQLADYGWVADWKEALPALEAELEKAGVTKG